MVHTEADVEIGMIIDAKSADRYINTISQKYLLQDKVLSC